VASSLESYALAGQAPPRSSFLRSIWVSIGVLVVRGLGPVNLE
jgi:hypothetical protein